MCSYSFQSIRTFYISIPSRMDNIRLSIDVDETSTHITRVSIQRQARKSKIDIEHQQHKLEDLEPAPALAGLMTTSVL